jgi:hypothetical protein
MTDLNKNERAAVERVVKNDVKQAAAAVVVVN